MNEMKADEQRLIYKFYIDILRLMFANCKIKDEQLKSIIGKLPELIKEWSYIEVYLKERGFLLND